MNPYHAFLQVANKILAKPVELPFYVEKDSGKASDMIEEALTSERPCMIGRFGSNELRAMAVGLARESGERYPLSYISGKSSQWWWTDSMVDQMRDCAGFFPSTPEMLQRFTSLMKEDVKELDIFGSWFEAERFVSHLLKDAKAVRLRWLEPFWNNIYNEKGETVSYRPYTQALKNKKVLVVHPFANTIRSQYSRRDLIFPDGLTLPEFKTFEVIPAVQTIGGKSDEFNTWFEALDFMKREIDNRDYDVCLLGCGAYGFPLAAHVKRSGKKAIHLGGALQLLFGIRGRRWEVPGSDHLKLMNEYWVRPSEDETPSSSSQVEGGCYW